MTDKPTFQDFKEAWANEMGRLCEEHPEAELDDLKREAEKEVMTVKQTNDNQQDQKR